MNTHALILSHTLGLSVMAAVAITCRGTLDAAHKKITNGEFFDGMGTCLGHFTGGHFTVIK